MVKLKYKSLVTKETIDYYLSIIKDEREIHGNSLQLGTEIFRNKSEIILLYFKIIIS